MMKLARTAARMEPNTRPYAQRRRIYSSGIHSGSLRTSSASTSVGPTRSASQCAPEKASRHFNQLITENQVRVSANWAAKLRLRPRRAFHGQVTVIPPV